MNEEKYFPGNGCKQRERDEKHVKFEGSQLIGRVADYTGLGAVWRK